MSLKKSEYLRIKDVHELVTGTTTIHSYSSPLFHLLVLSPSETGKPFTHPWLSASSPGETGQDPAPGLWWPVAAPPFFPPTLSSDSAPRAGLEKALDKIVANLNWADQVHKALVNWEPFRRL